MIKNYISSILASEEGKITDAQQEFLGVVINKSARLERQINDLLDLSHLEGEADQLFLSPTDLYAMLQDVVLNIQPQADTKQIRLRLDASANLPKLMLNSDRLGQVFVHLLQHAVRVTAVGGEIGLQVNQTLDTLVVKITDGGTPPLSPEQAGQIFNQFHGQDSKAGPNFAGTGLRFPIMKYILEAHHGLIQMRGLPERGNETVVQLPKTTAEEGYEAAPASRSAAAADETRPEETSPEKDFDLSAFMDRAPESGSAPAVPGSGEHLDDLLRDIENMDDRMAP